MNSHSSIIHNQNSITYNLIISPEQCALASKKREIVVKEFGHTFTLPIKFNEKIQSNYNHGQTTEKNSVTDSDGRGHIKHYTFETYMQ